MRGAFFGSELKSAQPGLDYYFYPVVNPNIRGYLLLSLFWLIIEVSVFFAGAVLLGVHLFFGDLLSDRRKLKSRGMANINIYIGVFFSSSLFKIHR